MPLLNTRFQLYINLWLQLTRSVWDATLLSSQILCRYTVTTHVPGARQTMSTFKRYHTVLQSPCLMRGTTIMRETRSRPLGGFNPRIPCGTRRYRDWDIPIITDVPTHAPKGRDAESLSVWYLIFGYNPRTHRGATITPEGAIRFKTFKFQLVHNGFNPRARRSDS